MFDNLILSIQERQVLNEVYEDLQKYFELKDQEDFQLNLKDYFMCSSYPDVQMGATAQIAEGEGMAYISFVKVIFPYVLSRYASRSGYPGEYQVYAVAKLPKDFGHVFIRKETFGDKLVEFFQPLEMDFEDDRKFSNRYYVLSKDRSKGEKLFTLSFREELNKILLQDYCVEVLGDTLVISNKKIPNKEETLAMASFVYNVSELRF